MKEKIKVIRITVEFMLEESMTCFEVSQMSDFLWYFRDVGLPPRYLKMLAELSDARRKGDAGVEPK